MIRSVFSENSQARLLGVSLVLFGMLPGRITGSPLRNFSTLSFFRAIIFSRIAPCPRKTIVPGLLVLEKVGFLTLFVAVPLEGLIGLTKALSELGGLDLPVIGISLGR